MTYTSNASGRPRLRDPVRSGRGWCRTRGWPVANLRSGRHRHGVLAEGRQGAVLPGRRSRHHGGGGDRRRHAQVRQAASAVPSVADIAPAIGPGNASVSRDGERFVIAVPRPQLRQLTVYDRSGKVVSKVGEPGFYNQPNMSPDGTRAVVMRNDPQTGNDDIWTMDLASGKGTPITNDTDPQNAPIWSPDGKQVAYVSTHESISEHLPQGRRRNRRSRAAVQLHARCRHGADRLVAGQQVHDLLHRGHRPGADRRQPRRRRSARRSTGCARTTTPDRAASRPTIATSRFCRTRPTSTAARSTCVRSIPTSPTRRSRVRRSGCRRTAPSA